ncbi:MAG: FAD-dependent oxidoreductase [Casimicrobiaceae bacterium]
MADVAIVGGGVAGLIAALELASGGHRVRVLDAGDFAQGRSHGNAGLLCPSYVTPLASPLVLTTALSWLARGNGPFSLARAPWRTEMARWLSRFVAACAGNSEEATRFLAALARESIDWYDKFAHEGADIGLRRDGWLTSSTRSDRTSAKANMAISSSALMAECRYLAVNCAAMCLIACNALVHPAHGNLARGGAFGLPTFTRIVRHRANAVRADAKQRRRAATQQCVMQPGSCTSGRGSPTNRSWLGILTASNDFAFTTAVSGINPFRYRT